MFANREFDFGVDGRDGVEKEVGLEGRIPIFPSFRSLHRLRIEWCRSEKGVWYEFVFAWKYLSFNGVETVITLEDVLAQMREGRNEHRNALPDADPSGESEFRHKVDAHPFPADAAVELLQTPLSRRVGDSLVVEYGNDPVPVPTMVILFDGLAQSVPVFCHRVQRNAVFAETTVFREIFQNEASGRLCTGGSEIGVVLVDAFRGCVGVDGDAVNLRRKLQMTDYLFDVFGIVEVASVDVDLVPPVVEFVGVNLTVGCGGYGCDCSA